MKVYKYLGLLAALFIVAACNDIDDIQGNTGVQAGDCVQIVGRMIPFKDVDVATRANDENKPSKEGDEANIACMDLLVFDNDGKCVYYQHAPTSNPVFVLEKKVLAEQYNVYKSMFYAFANTKVIYNTFGIDNSWTGKSIDDFKALLNDVNGIDMPVIKQGDVDVRCFPSMGQSLGTVDLESETIAVDENGNGAYEASEAKATIDIYLYSIYSRIVVNIDLEPIQTITGKYPPEFRMTSWEVHNVPKKVNFSGTLETAENNVEVCDTAFAGECRGDEIANLSNTISFSFYLPERLLQPKKNATSYEYPFKQQDGTIRDEDLKMRQRYKPCLVEGQNATFLRFAGVYLDHQNHEYEVSYDIYVGENEFDNFMNKRNYSYENNITIKGVKKSADGTESTVSVDHRVNVKRIQPYIVNVEREVKLDSHFEVRPMRIKPNTQAAIKPGANAKLKVEVVDPNDEGHWIRIEHKNEDGNDDRYCRSGKRKYFTYGLVSGKNANGDNEQEGYTLVNCTSVTVPVNNQMQTVWIYADENIDPDYFGEKKQRSAKIRVSYAEDGVNFEEPVEYQFNQYGLYTVNFKDGQEYTYYIETEEEYLYNYDSEDPFTYSDGTPMTYFQGLPWGLDGLTISSEISAVNVDADYFSDIINWFANNNTIKYDFYLPRDFHDQTKCSAYSGYNFFNKVLTAANNSTAYNISILALDQFPKHAIEYCYNRNKRNPDGTVAKVSWYLPAIDEMEKIVENGYFTFDEFKEQLYWSSQPAFYQNKLHYNVLISAEGYYYNDNPNRARATRVVYDVATEDYDPDPSGAGGFYQVLHIKGRNDHTPYNVPCEYRYQEWWSGKTMKVTQTPTFEPGNRARTERNRIRVAYKLD